MRPITLPGAFSPDPSPRSFCAPNLLPLPSLKTLTEPQPTFPPS
jgi:hypothetical protein